MKRRLHPDELRLWRTVASTVRALDGRSLPEPEATTPVAGKMTRSPAPPAASATPRPAPPRKAVAAPHIIEPNRERRIMLGREAIGARLDLHGMDQDQARAQLSAFLVRAQAEGHRAVLVITGRGRAGGGILRRRVPDWLGEAPLRGLVAGISIAHRRHGGEGAFYVALKRKG